MNVSDRRGKPVSRYAIEPAGSAICALENPAQTFGAASELEASLDVGPSLPPEALPQLRPPGEHLERAGERPRIPGRHQDAGPPRRDAPPYAADAARHPAAPPAQRPH